jgi:hypothetical protein
VKPGTGDAAQRFALREHLDAGYTTDEHAFERVARHRLRAWESGLTYARSRHADPPPQSFRHRHLHRHSFKTVMTGAHASEPAITQGAVMTSRNIAEAAADIDDATATIEELQAEPDVDVPEKLKQVHESLDHASDVLDDEVEDDEGDDKEDKVEGVDTDSRSNN